MQPMVFEGTKIELITRDGDVWITAGHLGQALGYADGKAVQRIYSRNSDEFTGTMAGVVKLTTPAGTQGVRVFSLRGAHLIAMLARTQKAKAFRRWVLDILDTIARGGEYARQQWEQARQALEDRREQASADGQGLAAWRWRKAPLESSERYWRERVQLALPL